jgi:hypothetical protein
MEKVSRKRPLSEVENTKSAPANKRQEIEPKSPKTAIRDASEALIEAIRKAEDVLSRPTESNPKTSSATVSNGNKKQDVSADAAAGFEFQKDKPTGLPYIYLVLEKTHDRRAIYGSDTEVLSTFATPEDANNCVRIRCADYAERDDPDALFTEEMTLDGRISWTYEDDEEYERQVWVERFVINTPGSVPAQDWGRPIGAPCPPKEDSEFESSSSYDE